VRHLGVAVRILGGESAWPGIDLDRTAAPFDADVLRRYPHPCMAGANQFCCDVGVFGSRIGTAAHVEPFDDEGPAELMRRSRSAHQDPRGEVGRRRRPGGCESRDRSGHCVLGLGVVVRGQVGARRRTHQGMASATGQFGEFHGQSCFCALRQLLMAVPKIVFIFVPTGHPA